MVIQEPPHGLFSRGIQVLKRLVEQQHAWLVEQGPRPTQPLPHARRERSREPIGRQCNESENVRGTRLGQRSQAREELEILDHRELVIEREVGGDVADAQAALPRLERSVACLVMFAMFDNP